MNRIKEVLDEKGIKQKWLAEKLGKSYNMVNSYAQNRRQPSLEDLYKIAEILNVEAKELLVKPFFQCKQHATGFFKVESDIFSDYTFASHTSQNMCLLNTCIRREIMRLEPLISSGAYQNVTLRS